MFGLFKKKRSKDALTSLADALYAAGVKLGQFDLALATDFAYDLLLNEVVPRREVAELAKSLGDGRIPYSTEDLALSTALNFFRRDEFKPHLQIAQLQARMQMVEWLQDGKVNSVLAQAFEKALYDRYKPGC